MNICIKIKLDSGIDIIQFTAAASKCKNKAECVSGERQVNCKSILGLSSMDLSKPFDVIFYDADEKAEFLTEIKKWEVK